METFELAVIGAGAAGLSVAATAAAAGRRVVLVESGNFGGECTWVGCVPSKAIIAAARRRHDALNASRFGIEVSGVTVNFPAVMAHVHDVIAQIARFEDPPHLEASGIVVRRGHAELSRAGTLARDGRTAEDERIVISVDGERLLAERVAVCTGSSPAVPPVPGLDSVDHLTNETLFELDQLPQRLVVLGAGPIGLEMAQAFQRLGSAVTVVDMVPDILPREDPEAAAIARSCLEAEGIGFVLGAKVTGARQSGPVRRLVVEVAGEERVLEGEALLVATGRHPRTEGLGLEALGVAVEKRGVTVDAYLRTTNPNVYAAGDVNGLMPFTHAAANQGRLVAANAFGRRRTKFDDRVLPWITFIDPEVAHLGMTEPEARGQYGDDIHVATLPYTAVDRAVIERSLAGVIKVITRGKPVIGHLGGGEVLGAHIVGPDAGELIHEFVLTMNTHSFAGRLAQAIHAYPSMAMGVQQAAAQLFPSGRAVAGDLRTSLREGSGAEATDPAGSEVGSAAPGREHQVTGGPGTTPG
ncbi:MAG: NAD(P)/FAD-dependent oxidoreductase [Candidatus Dormibacteria bacterium]